MHLYCCVQAGCVKGRCAGCVGGGSSSLPPAQSSVTTGRCQAASAAVHTHPELATPSCMSCHVGRPNMPFNMPLCLSTSARADGHVHGAAKRASQWWQCDVLETGCCHCYLLCLTAASLLHAAVLLNPACWHHATPALAGGLRCHVE